MLGVVLAALLELPSTWTLIGFTVAFGLGVIYLIDRTDLGSDTVLCISLSGSVALDIAEGADIVMVFDVAVVTLNVA